MMKRAWIYLVCLHVMSFGIFLTIPSDVAAEEDPLEVTYAYLQEKMSQFPLLGTTQMGTVNRFPRLGMTQEETKSLYGEPDCYGTEKRKGSDAPGDFDIYVHGNVEMAPGEFHLFFKDSKVEGIIVACKERLLSELCSKIGFTYQMIAIPKMAGERFASSWPVKAVCYDHQNQHVIIGESKGVTTFVILGDALYASEVFPFKSMFDSVNTGK